MGDVSNGISSGNERQVGDLGNIDVNEQGRAEFKFSDRLVKVSDIIGRSVVVAGQDDSDDSLHPPSKINGSCEEILSCGIIARSAGLFQNSKRICACDGVTLWDERDKPLVGTERSNVNNKVNKNATSIKSTESFQSSQNNCNIL